MKKTDDGKNDGKVSVELSLYFKQGDDFSMHLKNSKDRPAAALEAWAEQLVAGAKALRGVARKIAGKRGVTASGDTHLVSIDGLSRDVAEEVLKVAKGFAVVPQPVGGGPDEEE